MTYNEKSQKQCTPGKAKRRPGEKQPSPVKPFKIKGTKSG